MSAVPIWKIAARLWPRTAVTSPPSTTAAIAIETSVSMTLNPR
jgi:hypothetical protein